MDLPPVVFSEPEDGYWPLILILSVVGGLCAWWWWSLGFWGTVGVGVGAFVLLGGVSAALGFCVFGRVRSVEQKRTRTFHTCLHCLNETKSSRTS